MAIHNDMVYFGNRNYMQWVPAPVVNYESSKRGYATTATYLNGGAFVKRSATAAKGYNLTWNMKTRDAIRTINDYADGVYGEGPIYFLDPFAMDKNLLPQFWATPALGARDAPLLYGEFDEDRPTLIQTGPNNLGQPTNSAYYTLGGGKKVATMWIPCPPGYSLWFGAHGATEGDAVVGVVATTGATTLGPYYPLPWLNPADPTRMTTRINGDQYNGARIALAGSSKLAITSIMAQCLPNNVAPSTGGYISGQGHSGLSFVEEPTLTNYSAAIDRVGIIANLIETEGWK